MEIMKMFMPAPGNRKQYLFHVVQVFSIGLVIWLCTVNLGTAPQVFALQAATLTPTSSSTRSRFQEFSVPEGSGPHDVAPTPDGKVWYTAQHSGELGLL